MIIIIGKLFFTSQRYLCYYVIPLIYTFVIVNIIDQFIYWIIYIQKIAIPSEEKYSIWSESLVDKFIKKKLPSFGVHRLIRLVFEEACSQGKSVQHEISTVFPCEGSSGYHIGRRPRPWDLAWPKNGPDFIASQEPWKRFETSFWATRR